MDESIQLDEAVAGSVSEGAPDTTQTLPEMADDTFQKRLERIQDQRTEAQHHPDSRCAGVAGLNADLMEIGLHVGGAVRRFLTAEPATIEGIEVSSGSIDLMIRLSKQITQICQLEMRLNKSSGEVGTSPIRPR